MNPIVSIKLKNEEVIKIELSTRIIKGKNIN